MLSDVHVYRAIRLNSASPLPFQIASPEGAHTSGDLQIKFYKYLNTCCIPVSPLIHDDPESFNLSSQCQDLQGGGS